MNKCAVIAVTVFVLCSFPSKGQEYSERTDKNDRTAFIDRWSLKFNAIDFMLTVPNLGVEFDLSGSKYNRFTASVYGRYRWWNTKNPQYYVFGVREIRPELRYYWRNRHKDGTSGHKAYFLGIYGSAGDYSVKTGKYGYKGPEYGSGLAFGYAIPLYGYRKIVIDLELGASVGFIATDYDVYTYDSQSDTFAGVPERSTDMHILPFPVVAELKATFVFRHKSVSEKYRKVNQERIIRRQDRQMKRKNI